MQTFLVLTIAAAPPSAWEQLQHVPKQTWINLIICVLAVVIIIRVWRTLKRVNEYAPYFVSIVAAFLICCYWVYERTEPRFLSPLVDKLAPFFPTKAKQGEIEEKRRRGRDV